MDRQDLMDAVVSAPALSGSELAQGFKEGTILWRLVGHLVRRQAESERTLATADLISDEGRLRAIKQQGLVQGRQTMLEEVVDLILEGLEDDESGPDEPEH